MYWNTGSVQAYNHNAWLTLTWDVLKYGNRKEGTVTITD